jgi:hypothetical protein
MTDQEQNRFEAELRRTRPAKLPEDFWSRLLVAARPTKTSPVALGPAPVALGLQRVLRFLIPATAAAALILLAWRLPLQPKKPNLSPNAPSPSTSLRADEVQIDQDLVSSFDALAKLPDGEPVRFQCRQWIDRVTFSDKEHGLVLQESTPRVEVVAVGFETY